MVPRRTAPPREARHSPCHDSHESRWTATQPPARLALASWPSPCPRSPSPRRRPLEDAASARGRVPDRAGRRRRRRGLISTARAASSPRALPPRRRARSTTARAEAGFGNERGRPHEGQDIFAATGTPVDLPDQDRGARDRQPTAAAATGRRSTTRPATGPSSTSTWIEPAEVAGGSAARPGDRVGQRRLHRLLLRRRTCTSRSATAPTPTAPRAIRCPSCRAWKPLRQLAE